MTSSPPIFDGHNDTLLRLWLKKKERAFIDFLEGDGEGHIDLPRLKKGGMVGGLFAVFSPPENEGLPDDDDLNPPLADGLNHATALRSMRGMKQLLDEILHNSMGDVVLCCTVAEIRAAMMRDAVAVVFHIEGAEAVATDLSNLEALYAEGLRSIGPVWSRPNHFGHGVPFRFPSSPDTGPGLTERGVALVKACNEMRIAIDLSHITEKGFWDVAKLSDAPLIASHSNAHAVCRSSRNLTDDQLKAIRDTGGIAGLNYATGFLRDDGYWSTSTPPDIMLRHLDHMLRIAGEDCVGLGSDFDGARIPSFIGDCAGLPALVSAMQTHGYGDDLIARIAHQNWLRVLEKTWGA